MGTGSRALPGLGARWGVGLLALLIAAVMVSLAAGAYPVPLAIFRKCFSTRCSPVSFRPRRTQPRKPW